MKFIQVYANSKYANISLCLITWCDQIMSLKKNSAFAFVFNSISTFPLFSIIFVNAHVSYMLHRPTFIYFL